jgi:hypothetical protein
MRERIGRDHQRREELFRLALERIGLTRRARRRDREEVRVERRERVVVESIERRNRMRGERRRDRLAMRAELRGRRRDRCDHRAHVVPLDERRIARRRRDLALDARERLGSPRSRHARLRTLRLRSRSLALRRLDRVHHGREH